MPKYYPPDNIKYPEARVPTPRQLKFVDGLRMGLIPNEAAKAAGAKHPKSLVRSAMSNPWVILQAKEIRDEIEQKMSMSRQKVQDIIMTAIGMAKLQAIPADMIRGAAELNKMLGYYAPEEKVISLDSTEGKIATELETMTEAELLALAGKELDVIEAEFEVLDLIHEEEDE